MPNRLADAISPYLRSHADNPVHWQPWGPAAFADAAERDLPVFVSIGYSTCHWCHVMARETFSDPALAGYLNENFVSIKVDREEHPDVDASYLASASAFVDGLGWPLNVFVTPEGRAFHAGTYFPPRPMPGHPSFRQVLEAVTDAWRTRRAEVTEGAARVAEALSDAGRLVASPLPGSALLGQTVAELAAYEDTTFGGFGGAPKFPVAPVLGFLLARPEGRELALRTLKRLGASPLRDPVEGGFFRYAVNRNWSDPHYERMLYDNAQLLEHYTRAWTLTGEPWARIVAEGVAGYLLGVLQLPGGGFASAQDSESTVAGTRVEGGYYALGAEDRLAQTPPALDEKVLTGWNGLAIGALARAGFAFADPRFLRAAGAAADYLLGQHVRGDGTLLRASIAGPDGAPTASTAPATLEDYGMFAGGLLELALVTGQVRYAVAARDLLDSTLVGTVETTGSAAETPFRVPTGGDPVLVAQGLSVDLDPSEGAYPSGLSASAAASALLFELTARPAYRDRAEAALALVAGVAPGRPLAFGAALRVIAALGTATEQLVVVGQGDPHGALLDAVRRRPSGVVAVVSEAQARAFADAGFALFADRPARGGVPTAYLCHDFVCRLPVTDPVGLI